MFEFSHSHCSFIWHSRFPIIISSLAVKWFKWLLFRFHSHLHTQLSPIIWVVRKLKFGGMKIVQIIFTIKFSNVVCVALAICIYFPATASTFPLNSVSKCSDSGSLKIRTQWRGFRHAKQLLALLKGAKVSVAIECNQTSLCHCRLDFKSNYFWKRSLVCAMSHNYYNNNNNSIASYSVVTNNNNNNISYDNEFQAITIST